MDGLKTVLVLILKVKLESLMLLEISLELIKIFTTPPNIFSKILSSQKYWDISSINNSVDTLQRDLLA